MHNEQKPIFWDSGIDHPMTKRQWAAAILAVIGNALLFSNFAWMVIFTTVTILLTRATTKAIKEIELNIYADRITGYGFKFWDFLPRVHGFELKPHEINSIKQHKWGININSTDGRYRLLINKPDFMHEKIRACIQ
ncbi:MAG: hypothetical protein LBE35_06155 [Clostridiales bacterium]|jgi:hypothetical protein|nr:hypothetical protein [Clostridiales bacterium]